MVFLLRRDPEPVRAIVRSWIAWFGDTVRGTLASTLALAGILGAVFTVVALVHGLQVLFVFIALFLSVVFAVGPFGDVYRQARLARRYPQKGLMDPPPAPSRRRMALSILAAVALVVGSAMASWLILGYGWDRPPLTGRFSPWTILLSPLAGLVILEMAVRVQIRREIRCREEALTKEPSRRSA
jgi:hypothetical protein